MTQRDRIVLGVFATLATLAGFWFLLLSPKREEAAKAAEKVTAAQVRVDAARSKLIAGEAAKKDYSQQVLTVARLGKAVPPSDDVPSLVYQLERTARRSGIDFRAVKLDASTATASAPSTSGTAAAPAAGLTPLPFKLTFQGTFFDLRKFLDHVHSFTKPKGAELDVRGRLMTVDGVSLLPGPGGFPQVRAEVVATAYSAPAADAKAAAAGATPGSATSAAPAGAAPGSTASAPASPTPPAIVGGLLP